MTAIRAGDSGCGEIGRTVVEVRSAFPESNISGGAGAPASEDATGQVRVRTASERFLGAEDYGALAGRNAAVAVRAGAEKQGPRYPGMRPGRRACARLQSVFSEPKITVHWLDRTPPLPCAKVTPQFGTWRGPHSPRICRTASIITSNPYIPGWQ
jgi:hypothetical protein